MQGALGKVSDYQAIQRVVEGDRALEDHIRHTLKRKVKDLRHEWRAFDSEGELKRWRTYLAGQHSKPRPARTHRGAAKKTATAAALAILATDARMVAIPFSAKSR